MCECVRDVKTGRSGGVAEYNFQASEIVVRSWDKVNS